MSYSLLDALGDFARLGSYLAQVLHLVMHIPLWHVTGDRLHVSECIEKKIYTELEDYLNSLCLHAIWTTAHTCR